LRSVAQAAQEDQSDEKGKRQCTLSVEGRPSMQRPPMGNRWPRRGAVVGGREELGPVATSKSQVTI